MKTGIIPQACNGNQVQIHGCTIILNDYQLRCIGKWSELIKNGCMEEYFSDARKLLVSPEVSSNPVNFLTPFYVVEKTYACYKDRAYRPAYIELFSSIRDILALRSIANGKFEVYFFCMTELMQEGMIALGETESCRQVIRHFLCLYADSSKQFDKFFYASYVFLFEAFSGNLVTSRTEYLRRFIDLNISEITGMLKDYYFPFFSTMTRSLFSSPGELLELLREHVFNEEEFFSKRIDSQKSNLMWTLNVFWNIYGFDSEFIGLYAKWVDLFRGAIERNLVELVFFMHLPLSHLYGQLTSMQEEWQKFNENIERPLSRYITEIVVKASGIQRVERKIDRSQRPIKIGFVYDRIVMNSPFKVLYSLLKALRKNCNDECELHVYDLEYIDKSPSNPAAVSMIEERGIPYISNHRIIDDAHRILYYNHFNKAMRLRERIIEDNIDILIMCDGREQFNFLFSTRTAPVQVYWSHGNLVYDIEGIDARISHSFSDHEEFVKRGFREMRIPQDSFFLNPPVDEEKVRKIRDRFPDSAVILGSIARTVKIESDAYLETVAEIMRMAPHTVYLACGSSDTEIMRRKVEDLGLSQRFFFEGYVDPHLYGHVIDVALGTFPLDMGYAIDELFAKGKIVILLVQQKEKWLEEVLGQLGITYEEAPWALSQEEYIRKALLFIGDERLRNTMGQAVRRMHQEYMDACMERFQEEFRLLVEHLAGV
ncbi:MAG: hypothetical protein HY731_00580 [Candidatus Tectomicrobia bacterium]|nr:hypothetical protein [Candidatus Tectomicrobia bacterium]